MRSRVVVGSAPNHRAVGCHRLVGLGEKNLVRVVELKDLC